MDGCFGFAIIPAMTILVDTRGACYSPGSSELRARYGAALSSEALPDFLVRNVGFIELGFNGDTATIRCAPARIELAGYSRAIRIVHQHNPRLCPGLTGHGLMRSIQVVQPRLSD